MLNFTNSLKIYLFKDKNQVSFSVKISDSCVNEYTFTIDEFDDFISQWDSQTGIDRMYSGRRWSVLHKKSTPRPESNTASYIRLSVYINGIGIHQRVDYTDMMQIRKEYFYQKNNKMYWD